MNDSKKIVESIIKEYTPFSNVEGRLLGTINDDRLKVIIDQHCLNLPAAVANRIHHEFFAWGPITDLLDRDNLNEIIINGESDIFYEDPQGLHRHSDTFYSSLTFRNFISRIGLSAQCMPTINRPFCNGAFKNYRLHMVIPPIAEKPLVTLRQHLKQRLQLQNYLTDGIANEAQYAYLQKLINEQANFLIVGNTGSGKTTLLNCLLQTVSDQDRVLIVEDTPEIQIPNRLSVRLVTRDNSENGLAGIAQQELVKQALRMRPSRVVMGEVRGEEAKDLLQALATGHRGSLGTIHADSPKQALYRLEMLIQMGAPQWDLQAIRRLIQLSLDHLVVIKKHNGKRSIAGIFQLASLEEFGFLVNKIC